MGINYYTRTIKCKSCGHKPEGIHLGKATIGTKFVFHLHEKYYNNIEELREWLHGKRIENEYNKDISFKDFWRMIKEKQQESDDIDALNVNGYNFFDRDFS